MKLLVGLGNQGPKYEKNRHNVGFLFVHFLFESLLPSSHLKQEWKYDKYISAESSILETKENTLIFLKPQNYMNNSGISVGSITKKLNISSNNIIVIHDDLDIPLGKFKLSLGVGPKLHNGISSIEQHLKTTEFYRLRIGVDNRQETGNIPGESYVLLNFLEEEFKILNQTFQEISAQQQFGKLIE
ncbi:MAG: aminoacyl-tRNA hydrolase [Candidatus Roizmanbacteria bacterium]